MRTFTDHHIPRRLKHRPLWYCVPAPGGGHIGWEHREPYIKAKHVDGPLLVFSDGQLHWLTFGERVQFMFGWTDAAKLQAKLRPNLMRGLAAHRETGVRA